MPKVKDIKIKKITRKLDYGKYVVSWVSDGVLLKCGPMSKPEALEMRKFLKSQITDS